MAASPVPSSQLQVSIEKAPDQVTVRCAGKIILETSDFLQNSIGELIPHAQHIVLDMGEVNYVDSSGLGALISVYTAARKAQCKLEIANPKPRIAELFKMTRLDEVFAGRAEIDGI
jgi:anti-sigma B factor antagonist